MVAFSEYGHIMRIAILFSIFYFATCNSPSKIIKLNEENWTQMLDGEWMVEFFAPWCPACKALESTWQEFAEWSKDLDIQVAQVDVTINPGMSGRFLVTALPTIYHVFKGQFRQYRGSRDKENFISFIEDKKWESLEQVPAWKTPSSILMSLVSYFFKLSMVLRSIHTKLIDEYGIPYWGSYLIFALSTILVGTIFGLILVCVIDFVFPPKAALPPSPRSDISDFTTRTDAKSEDGEAEIKTKIEEATKSREDGDTLKEDETKPKEDEDETKPKETEELKPVEDVVEDLESVEDENSTAAENVRRRRPAQKEN